MLYVVSLDHVKDFLDHIVLAVRIFDYLHNSGDNHFKFNVFHAFTPLRFI